MHSRCVFHVMPDIACRRFRQSYRLIRCRSIYSVVSRKSLKLYLGFGVWRKIGMPCFIESHTGRVFVARVTTVNRFASTDAVNSIVNPNPRLADEVRVGVRNLQIVSLLGALGLHNRNNARRDTLCP